MKRAVVFMGLGFRPLPLNGIITGILMIRPLKGGGYSSGVYSFLMAPHGKGQLAFLSPITAPYEAPSADFCKPNGFRV